jgi:hypothetical protein
MRSVSRTDHPLTGLCRTARVALLPAAIVAAALCFAAPGARAQSTGDAGAVAGTGGSVAFRGWLSGSATPLDDQTLSRQRGGALGMVMVAATPELMRGNGVTLWDEIAPPAPLPVPVDASQAAQGNIASYTRR